MKVNGTIKSAGEYIQIPIRETDQTIGLNFSGPFNAVIQILGYISTSSNESDLVAFGTDGTVFDLESTPPFDIFLDVSGYSIVRVCVLILNSGIVKITGVISTGPRPKPNGPGNVATGPDVQVTNFPSVFPVSGPLTLAQLLSNSVNVNQDEPTSGVALDNSLQAILNQLLGVDSEGHPLPANFYDLPFSVTYNGDNIQTETRISGSTTYTKTYNYDSNSNFIGASGWVPSS